jgi:putative ABC transport system substrate-binding protein
MIGRRRGLLVAAVLCLAPTLHAREPLTMPMPMPMPPGGRPWRIGWLTPGGADNARSTIGAFVAGLRAKGWVQGEHYTLELRTSDDARNYPVLAAELVALAPDVLVGIETTARVLRQYTTTIPIVLFVSIDPVQAGLVQSLAQPGGNVTGMAGQYAQIVGKWVEALVEIVPRATRLAVLYDPAWSDAQRNVALAQAAARAKGAQLEAVALSADSPGWQQALRALEARPPQGLLLSPSGGTLAHAGSILQAVRRLRLPAVGPISAGGLVMIGLDFQASARESADFVDRILRGARPQELPVRQAMFIRTTVNARLAREIGVEIPLTLRLRADEVIE